MAAKHEARRKSEGSRISKERVRYIARARDKRSATASEVKQLGWRGILELARKNNGQLPITNHNQTQGVVLTREAFESLQAKARSRESALEQAISELSIQFDERLAVLKGAKGASALRSTISSPARLHGKVKAGASH